MALPAGLRSYTYAEDKTIFRTRTQKWLLTMVLLLLLLSPIWLSSYWLGMVSLMGITIIAAAGLNIIAGYSGQLSAGHAGFIAVGAYFSAIITGRYHQPFIVGLIGAGLISGILGMLFALPSRKIKGWLLALVTVAAQLLILWGVNQWTSMTDGSAGLKVISPSLGFIDFNTATGQYFLIFIVAVITLFFGINLMRTRTGRAFIAIRDNERAAEAVGINPVATKMLAFFIGCAMAGTAGSLMAHWSGFININSFSLADSVFYAGILLICGFGTMWAPVIGGILLVLIKHQLAPMLAGTDLSPAQNLSNLITAYSGIILVLLIIVFLIIHRKKLLDSSLRWK